MIEKNIPKDEWVEIPDERLSKIGKTAWVYVPSNYHGPVAINAIIKKEKDEEWLT